MPFSTTTPIARPAVTSCKELVTIMEGGSWVQRLPRERAHATRETSGAEEYHCNGAQNKIREVRARIGYAP